MSDRAEEAMRWMAERNEKYGVALVYGAAGRRIFAEVTGAELHALGFQPRKDGAFVRVIDDDIIQLFELVGPTKGQQFLFRWGLSLSFMPHAWKDRPKWHRTVASARFDLFHFADDGVDPTSAEYDALIIDGLHGEIALREDLERAWGSSRSTITGWLDAIRTIDKVIEEADRQMSGTAGHAPNPRVVQAFALARLGQQESAQALLASVLESDEPYGILAPHQALKDCLMAIATRG